MDEVFLKKRHSVRSFRDKEIKKNELKEILDIKEDERPIAILPLGYKK